MNRTLLRVLWLVALLAGAALGGANLVLGELNQDEGWYLYAARLVAEGQWPYRDFAFTQAPLLPLAYSLVQPLLEWGGVAAGRAVTGCLTLLTALLAAALAHRLAPREGKGWAALAAFLLVAVNVYQSYFGTVVKTYALCGLLLTAGAWLLALARDRRSLLLHAMAGLLLAAAAGARISAGLMLPVAGLYLLQQRERCGRAAWLAFGLGGGLGLMAVFLPFIFSAPEAFRTLVLEYHSARSAGGPLSLLVFKVGCLARVVQAYFVAAALALGLLVAHTVRGAKAERDPLVFTLWIGLAALLLLHLSAPFPYDDYQVPLYPLFGALLAAALARALSAWEGPRQLAALVALLLINGAAAFSSPLNQGWLVLGRDRIWWRMREQPALLQLREVGRALRSGRTSSDLLLTQDLYLAVESGLRVPRGLEMGPFSYYPGLDRAGAEALHVVNRDMLEELIRDAAAPVAAFSEYSFVMAAPEVEKLSAVEQAGWWALVDASYALQREVPDFGQGATRLKIYQRRTGGTPR